jgi:hypothetical protein
MSNRYTPLTLHEAVVSLFLASPDGTEAVAEVFIGACTESIRLTSRLNEFRHAPTGATYQETHHDDEEHFIDLQHVWVVHKLSPESFKLQRNQHYIATVLWEDSNVSGLWYQRTYFNVTGMEQLLESGDASGAGAFMETLKLRAERWQSTAEGSGGTVPGLPVNSAGNVVGFFREDGLDVGDYLLGHYRWAANITLTKAKVIARASQVTATVLELEEGGVLTGLQLTIPIGTIGTEVTAELTLARVVPAHTELRWKVVSGPVSGTSTFAAVAMRYASTSPAVPVLPGIAAAPTLSSWTEGDSGWNIDITLPSLPVDADSFKLQYQADDVGAVWTDAPWGDGTTPGATVTADNRPPEDTMRFRMLAQNSNGTTAGLVAGPTQAPA